MNSRIPSPYPRSVPNGKPHGIEGSKTYITPETSPIKLVRKRTSTVATEGAGPKVKLEVEGETNHGTQSGRFWETYPRRKCESYRFVMEQSNEEWSVRCWGELVTSRDVEPFGNVVMRKIGI